MWIEKNTYILKTISQVKVTENCPLMEYQCNSNLIYYIKLEEAFYYNT